MCLQRVLSALVLLHSTFVIAFQAVSNYLDRCNESDECTDHRFVCIPQADGMKRCVCDRFHKWGGKDHGCYQRYDYREIINMTYVENDVAVKLRARLHMIFNRHLAAAYFIIGVIVATLVVVILYCIHIKRRDSELEEMLYGKRNKPSPENIPVTADV